MKHLMKKMAFLALALVVAVSLAALPASTSEAASKPKKITLKASSKSVVVGKTVKVSVKSVKPKNASKSVTYKSSNKSIATVTSKGTVKGIKPGKVTITATSKKTKKVKAKITITVKTKPSIYKSTQVYVSPEWVKDVLDKKVTGYTNAFVGEVSWGSLDSAKAYKEAHIKGAVHINSDEVEVDDCDPWPMGDGEDDLFQYDPDNSYGSMKVDYDNNMNIRPADQLEKFMKRYGITTDTKVILYGPNSGNSAVTRVAFAMVYAGVKDVKVINGGFTAWQGKKYPTETTVRAPKAGGDTWAFGATIPVHPEYIMSTDEVVEAVRKDSTFRLMSIRSEDEFTGAKSGYGYIERAGEPLGAVWGRNTDDGTYTVNGKVADVSVIDTYLAESGASLANNKVSFYCGTGWRATIPFFLAYEAGYTNISVYDGGWMQYEYYNRQNPEKYPIQAISPAEAAENAKNGVNCIYKFMSKEDLVKDIAGDRTYTILDVRKNADYKTSHIVGSISADVDGTISVDDPQTAEANIKAAIAASPEGAKFALICYSGNRYAKSATDLLIKNGVSADNIRILTGGMKGWTATEYLAKTYTSKNGIDFADGITPEQLNTDLAGAKAYTVVDVRDAAVNAEAHIPGAISASLRDFYTNAAVSDEVGKAALEKVVNENPNGLYVLVCYTGNSFADKGTKILRDMLNVPEQQIITLEGGQADWKAAGYQTEMGTLPVEVDGNTITVYGRLNGTYLTEPTKHYMSTQGFSLGTKCLFTGLCDRLEYATALEDLGATPWNTNDGSEKDLTKLAVGDYITAENGSNSEFTHLDIKVAWNGHEPVAMADTLQSKTTDGKDLVVDPVFSNAKAVAANYQSGCLICTCSCYAGVSTNMGMPFVSGNGNTIGNAENLPVANTIVKIMITPKN